MTLITLTEKFTTAIPCRIKHDHKSKDVRLVIPNRTPYLALKRRLERYDSTHSVGGLQDDPTSGLAMAVKNFNDKVKGDEFLPVQPIYGKDNVADLVRNSKT